MDAIMEWGIRVISWFQQFSPTLDWPSRVFTFMGEEEFFLLLLPLIYWCLDRSLGARLIIAFLLSAYVNAAVKTLAALPRPSEYAPGRVKVLWEAPGYGFPSGHTQNAVVVCGYLATQVRRRWLWILATVIMLFVPLSRIYLGAHFPHDVLGGYVIGAVLLFLYLWLEPAAEEWLKVKGLAWQLGGAIAIPLVLIFLLPTGDGVSEGATLMGMGVGLVLERRWVGFDSGGPIWKRMARFLVGGMVLALLWTGSRVAFLGLEPVLFFRFLRYGLMGLWGSLGGPWVFRRLGLA